MVRDRQQIQGHWSRPGTMVLRTYWEVGDGVKVPLEVARAGQPLHDRSVSNVLINHSSSQHGVKGRQRG